MVAPALVGVVVGPGVHTVTFSYSGYGSYDALLLLALAVLAVLAIAPFVWRRVRRAQTPGDGSQNSPQAGL
jgi:membrane protein implicated in regulation of membrane protease activity